MTDSDKISELKGNSTSSTAVCLNSTASAGESSHFHSAAAATDSTAAGVKSPTAGESLRRRLILAVLLLLIRVAVMRPLTGERRVFRLQDVQVGLESAVRHCFVLCVLKTTTCCSTVNLLGGGTFLECPRIPDDAHLCANWSWKLI
jgi:hypothetical protein